MPQAVHWFPAEQTGADGVLKQSPVDTHGRHWPELGPLATQTAPVGQEVASAALQATHVLFREQTGVEGVLEQSPVDVHGMHCPELGPVLTQTDPEEQEVALGVPQAVHWFPAEQTGADGVLEQSAVDTQGRH